MGFVLADLAMGGTPDYAGQAQQSEQQRQAAINQGITNINQAFSGFNPQFYNQYKQAYTNWALPQLSDQYNQTKSQIGFGLANKGISESSAAGKAWSDLFRTNASAKQGIADAAQNQANQLQLNVADQQQKLYNNLYATADPGQAQASAISTAASLQQPATFAPLANMFSNLIQQYYTKQLLNPSGATGTTPQASFFAPIGGS